MVHMQVEGDYDSVEVRCAVRRVEDHVANTIEKVTLCLSVCLSVCLSLCLSVSLSLCLSVCLSVCLSLSLASARARV